MLNKKGFIDMLNESTGKTKKNIEESTDLVLSGIEEALKKYGGVKFVGFGNFEVRERKAKKGHHPETMEDLNIEARKSPFFKPGQTLKDAVN